MPCRSLAPARLLLPPLRHRSHRHRLPPRCHRRRFYPPARFVIAHAVHRSDTLGGVVITPAGYILPAYRPAPACRGTERGYGLTAVRSDVVSLLACLMTFPASDDLTLPYLIPVAS